MPSDTPPETPNYTAARPLFEQGVTRDPGTIYPHNDARQHWNITRKRRCFGGTT